MAKGDEMVSVVIPAYNAETTIAATLASVRNQTYRAIEVIVVNDGSKDGTAEKVLAQAREDPRIALHSIPNGGVAKARNHGIANSVGAYVAPIDADDLWHPETLERELAVLRSAGPETGLVYCYHRIIDAHDRVLRDQIPRPLAGNVYLRSLVVNPVGNGSAILMRREALDSVGGYTSGDVEGYEDHLIQVLISRCWKIAVLPEHLVGYRQHARSLSSSNFERTARSRLAVYRHVRARHPETPEDVVAAGEARAAAQIFVQAVFRRQPWVAAKHIRHGAWSSPSLFVKFTAFEFLQRAKRAWDRSVATSAEIRYFYDCDPASDPQNARDGPVEALMLALEARESCLQETRRHHGHGETRATGVASSSGDDRPAPMPPESDLPPAGLTP